MSKDKEHQANNTRLYLLQIYNKIFYEYLDIICYVFQAPLLNRGGKKTLPSEIEGGRNEIKARG